MLSKIVRNSSNVYKKISITSCKTTSYADFAEREGFEPPVPCSTPVFKTGAFDHSAISPCKLWSSFRVCECKGKYYFIICQTFDRLFFER